MGKSSGLKFTWGFDIISTAHIIPTASRSQISTSAQRIYTHIETEQNPEMEKLGLPPTTPPLPSKCPALYFPSFLPAACKPINSSIRYGWICSSVSMDLVQHVNFSCICLIFNQGRKGSALLKTLWGTWEVLRTQKGNFFRNQEKHHLKMPQLTKLSLGHLLLAHSH